MADFDSQDLKRLDGDLGKVATADLATLARFSVANASKLSGDRSARLMGALVKTRQFPLAVEVGQALQIAGSATPLSSKLFVQASIDTGQLSRSDIEIARLLNEILPDDPQHLELRGLSGRVAKQRYMNDTLAGTPRQEDLIQAIDTYLTAYDTNPDHPVWHGINAVALLARAVRDRVNHPACPRMTILAQDILDQVLRGWDAEKLTFWDFATASESALALGKQDTAELWLRRYVDSPGVPSFAVASTLRQYREVWQLSLRSLPGSILLPILERHLLLSGQVQLSIEDTIGIVSEASFEKVFGKASFLSYAKYVAGIERAKAVARVEDKDGDPQGTGFIVHGRDLSEKWAKYPQLLMTNAHVISDGDPKAALGPEQARFSFYGHTQGSPPIRRVDKVLWTSSFDDLDTTIVLMDNDLPGIQPYTQAGRPPKPGSDSKIFVIGYPGGGGLNFSLFDSYCLDYDGSRGAQQLGRKIHYRTPTEPGSSGSPVFNQNWELLALHHAGDEAMPKLNGDSGTYQANEGILLEAIRSALNSSL